MWSGLCSRPGTSASIFFFFTARSTTEIYTLSLHDALPISTGIEDHANVVVRDATPVKIELVGLVDELHRSGARSEEHTSELQSHSDLVCRLLLEKKKKQPSDERHADE